MASPDLTAGSRPLPESGVHNGSASSRPADAVHSFPWRFDLARPSSSIGVRITQFLAVNAPSCKLPTSSYRTAGRFWSVAYLLQTHEMLFDAHWHGFRVLGGIPGRGIYDNMKTAVDRVGRGKERQINMRFLAMTNHYVYEAEFCNPAAGWEKGQV